MSLEDCEKRGAVLDGKKCFCKPRNCWTNCLEVGYCVYEKHRKPKQGTLFDEMEIEG